MQGFSCLCIMIKRKYEWDFAVAGIRGNVYNWLVYVTVGNSVYRMWESCPLLFHVL